MAFLRHNLLKKVFDVAISEFLRISSVIHSFPWICTILLKCLEIILVEIIEIILDNLLLNGVLHF